MFEHARHRVCAPDHCVERLRSAAATSPSQMFHQCSKKRGQWRTRRRPPSQLTGNTGCESLRADGWEPAEHRVRTGDLRLGKANRPGQRRSPILTNRHQPSQTIRAAYRMRRHSITSHPQRCTTVVFHGCSKTGPDRSTLLRSQSSWVGRKRRSGRLASAGRSPTNATISTPTAFPVPQSLRSRRGTQSLPAKIDRLRSRWFEVTGGRPNVSRAGWNFG